MTAPPDDLQVPDCAGMALDECVQAFKQAGFTATPEVSWYDGKQVPVGHVIRTTPKAGTKVPRAKTARPIGIRLAGIVIPMPNRGERFDGYRRTLLNAGFTTIDVYTLPPERCWLDGPADAVGVVQPTPGTAIDPARVSEIAVSVHKNPAVMPEIRTRTHGLANSLRANNP